MSVPCGYIRKKMVLGKEKNKWKGPDVGICRACSTEVKLERNELGRKEQEISLERGKEPQIT